MIGPQQPGVVREQAPQQGRRFHRVPRAAHRVGQELAAPHGVLVVCAQEAHLLVRDVAQQGRGLGPVTFPAKHHGGVETLAQERTGRRREGPVQADGQQVRIPGAALLRLGQTFRLHPPAQLTVEIVDGQESGPPGIPSDSSRSRRPAKAV